MGLNQVKMNSSGDPTVDADANFLRNRVIIRQKQQMLHPSDAEDNLPIRFFSKRELHKATNLYHRRGLITEDSFCQYYKGTILGHNIIVKLPKDNREQPEMQRDRLATEIAILSSISHKNIACFLGCCLESNLPILIYSSFTLITPRLSTHLWPDRFRIATEISEALSYLHNSPLGPIVHKDIQLKDIMLDDKNAVKLCCFDFMKLMTSDMKLPSIVEGTSQFLDPKYLVSGVYNEKCDVYSFGGVLVQLLTWNKSMNAVPGFQLVQFFTSAMQKGRIERMLDVRISVAANEQVRNFAALAMECLRKSGEERPTMTEVEEKLKRIAEM